ncbi:MAG TPA: adenylate/guanylate cyclase domain-containing protein [Gaiellaceae bacterium]|nr:adenylate/guanylate cyclase domain-containing protein [Gaiellaceae bacterium]
MREDLPTGTVTFLFTDVEGSTTLLRSLGAEVYADALAEHRRIIREACATEGGVEVDTQGDAFFFAFATASGALAAAQTLTESLAPGQIHVRVGLHTGTPLVTGEGYVGDDVHRAARIAAVGHGGQVLVAASTAALVALDGLVDLGEHHFKDLAAPERIYQFGERTFPSLKSLYRSNLPLAANPLVGRKKELADVLQAILNGARTVTITGPGGVGKTRFALAVASEAADAFPGGVWFVPLASLRDSALVLPTVADAIGADGNVARHIGDDACLLFLDNFEQVVDAAPGLAALAGECPRLRLLVTSREALRIAIEREYPLSPLPESPSVELFRQRADAVAPELKIEYATAATICDRLDRLPLAIELAAARCKALSPEQILDRLSQGFDLLRGGRDADPRQQTLRATIEWSYGLLSDDEQRLFRALSVFRGGCTLDAAENVCGADLDTLQSLVEKSLLRFTSERYWMLETIREFADEQLSGQNEASDLRNAHADYFAAHLKTNDPHFLGSRHAELLAWFSAEEDNLRVMLDRLSETAPSEAAHGAYLLHPYWGARGAFVEARSRYTALLGRPQLPAESRAMLLGHLADIDEIVGDFDAAEKAVSEALVVAESAGAGRVLADALRNAAWIAVRRGRSEDAIGLARRAVDESAELDEPTRLHAVHDLGGVLAEAGRAEEARAVLQSAASDARRAGLDFIETFCVLNLGKLDLMDHEYASAHTVFASARPESDAADHYVVATFALWGLGTASLGLEHGSEARAAFGEMLAIVGAAGHGDRPTLALAMAGIALSADARVAPQAAQLRGAVAGIRETIGRSASARDDQLECRFELPLLDALGRERYEAELALGAAMSLEDSVELARSLIDS